MNICLVGTLPEAGREALRGPERTTIGLAESLDGAGHDVLVVSDEGDAKTVQTPARVIGDDLSPGLDRLIRFARRVRQEIGLDKFDIVHTWRPLPGADVFSPHSVNATETVERRRPGTFSLRWRAGAKLELFGKRLTARYASRTVVTAAGNVADAAVNGIRHDSVIPVGVDEGFLQRGGSTGNSVLCVGRIEPRKNQAFVAANTPSEYDLKLAGPESSEYAESIPGFESCWQGRLNTEELLAAYREADVFVLPSVFEGFGLTAVEAMAAGTPAVVADTCGIADHVAANPIGAVYEFDDAASYRRALAQVVNQQEAYGRRARGYVRAHLTWTAIAAQYEREYREAIGEPVPDGSDHPKTHRFGFGGETDQGGRAMVDGGENQMGGE